MVAELLKSGKSQAEVKELVSEYRAIPQHDLFDCEESISVQLPDDNQVNLFGTDEVTATS